MQDLYEAYLGIYEAKVDKGTPLEKEDIRNTRAFGSASSRDSATGMRGFYNEELEFILDYLVNECYADDYKSANYILESMSDYWIDSILCEEWRAADTGKISTQAYKKEKRGDSSFETLDAANRNLLAKNTKPPTERNLMGRRLQLARLRAANDKDHESIMNIASTTNMQDPKNQQQVMNIAGNISRRGKLAHTINTVANMQTRRTPKEQESQSASIRFHDNLRTKR
jgi:hypothetical protein